jgi:hypothetical protein
LAGFFSFESVGVSLLFLLSGQIFIRLVFKLAFWLQFVIMFNFAEVDLLNQLACAGKGFDVLPWHFYVDYIDQLVTEAFVHVKLKLNGARHSEHVDLEDLAEFHLENGVLNGLLSCLGHILAIDDQLAKRFNLFNRTFSSVFTRRQITAIIHLL